MIFAFPETDTPPEFCLQIKFSIIALPLKYIPPTLFSTYRVFIYILSSKNTPRFSVCIMIVLADVRLNKNIPPLSVPIFNVYITELLLK